MICNDCKLKKICKNYDYLIDHNELTISNCSYIQSRTEESFEFLNSLLKSEDTNNTNKLQEEEKEKTFKPRIVNLETDKIIKCPNCGVNTFESDIKECNACHKKVCSNCSTDITNIAKDGDDIIITCLCNDCNDIDESKNAYDSSSSLKDLLNFNLDKKGDK